MFNASHPYTVATVNFLHDGHMLLMCGVCHVTFKLHHRLATAYERAASGVQHFYYVAANGATIDFSKFCHDVSFLL